MTERFDLEKAVKIVGLNIHAESADEGRDFDVACRMIVNALNEIQQYRAVGTVEECEKAMDFELAKQDKMFAKVIYDYLKYIKIGTIDEFKALKEMNVVKKPIRNDLCTCPSCGTFNEVIRMRRNTVAFDTVYCWHCGQAIEIKRD